MSESTPSTRNGTPITESMMEQLEKRIRDLLDENHRLRIELAAVQEKKECYRLAYAQLSQKYEPFTEELMHDILQNGVDGATLLKELEQLVEKKDVA